MKKIINAEIIPLFNKATLLIVVMNGIGTSDRKKEAKYEVIRPVFCNLEISKFLK
jgi:hypothetical protein